MLKQFMRVLLATAALALSAHVADAASYTVHDVYQAAEAGHLQEAQAMMQQVLRDHPESAKAHYVEAELYAKGQQYDYARRELNTARRLDPTLGFARQDAVDALQARLDAAPRNSAFKSKSGSHWGLWLLGAGLIAIIAIAMRTLLRRPVMPVAGSFSSGSPYGGYAPGYGPNLGGGPGGMMGNGVGSGMGSGILGGLATGAAVGAGIVAGEALANHFVEGSHGNEYLANEHLDTTPPANDWDDNMGGNDFGLVDDSSWDSSSSGGDIGGDWS